MLFARYNLDLFFSGGKISLILSKDYLENCLTKVPHLHTHTKYEMHYFEKGNGIFQTEKTGMECPAGSLLIVPPGIKHRIDYLDDTQSTTLLFEPLQRDTSDVVFSSLFVKEPTLLPDTFGAKERLSHTRREMELTPTAFQERVRGEMTVLFADLCAALLPKNPGQAAAKPENRAEDIEEYLSSHCYEPDCSCEHLAERLHLSPRQVHRLCLSYYGAPFRTLLHQTRMEIARYRLENSEVSVTELAELMGYASIASFSAAYKRYFGQSPSQSISHYKTYY